MTRSGDAFDNTTVRALGGKVSTMFVGLPVARALREASLRNSRADHSVDLRRVSTGGGNGIETASIDYILPYWMAIAP